MPFGADTFIVERLADDLSAAFGVLRAPTIEYGVNSSTATTHPGNACVRRKTLHRFMNDLIGSWEEGGVTQFIILTAHAHDPHQEALSTLRTNRATIRTVDIFALPFEAFERVDIIHGGEIDTSILLHIDSQLVSLQDARDFVPEGRGTSYRIPTASPGSIGHPTRAAVEKGASLYHLIYDRIATRVLAGSAPDAGHR